MNNEAKSLIECLTEAAECDRLAGLARTRSSESDDPLRNYMAPSSGKGQVGNRCARSEIKLIALPKLQGKKPGTETGRVRLAWANAMRGLLPRRDARTGQLADRDTARRS